MITTLTGDCRAMLPTLADGSVHCVVTSPPYFGLRDYGTASWHGGDADCAHEGSDRYYTQMTAAVSSAGAFSEAGEANAARLKAGRWREGGVCIKCGAKHSDSQIGMEPTPDAYVAELVAVFREVRRVLRDDGTMWLNLGDSYAGSWGNQGRKDKRGTQRPINGGMLTPVLDGRYPDRQSNTGKIPEGSGLKPKDLIGIPWRVAFALQADGWYLRQDIIWSKPNPMPESVRDRCTKSHEYIFLLTKKPRYFYDAEAIAEPVTCDRIRGPAEHGDLVSTNGNGGLSRRQVQDTRNRRSVWEITTQPFSQAHFATFPPELAETCIKAGCPQQCCAGCGKPWLRETTESQGGKRSWHDHSDDATIGQSQSKHGQKAWDSYVPRQTLGFSPSCHCNADTVPGTVLDPFAGAGTAGLVADRLQRHAILIELNPAYAAMGSNRIADDAPLLAWGDGQ